MTALYGVIGDPVAHSLSPLIHNSWLADGGFDARYEAIGIPQERLDSGLKELMDRGACGLNVTLPHKNSALRVSSERSDTAIRIGAANTLTRTGDGWYADNTDAPGFLKTLTDAGIDVAGQTVGVIGAGGSARAVVATLSDAQAEVMIFNRTGARARSLAEDFEGADWTPGGLDALLEAGSAVDFLVNTTSVGHTGGRLRLPEGDGRLYYDISYGAAAAPGFSDAKRTGWRTLDGLPMLVAQAAFSFQIWFGVMPDTSRALALCRAKLEQRT